MFDPYMVLLLLDGVHRQDLAEEYRRAQSLGSGVRARYRRMAAACAVIAGRVRRPAGSADGHDTVGALAPAAAGEQDISRRPSPVAPA